MPRVACFFGFLLSRSRPGFRIECDRIETKETEVSAVGKVTFAGVGLNGACKRLTVTLAERRLVFESGVQLVREANSHLRGERIVWEIPHIDAGPVVIHGVLGAPK